MLRLILCCLLFLSACGPIQATTSIVRAEEEGRTAKLAKADEQSPYEFTKAELYLNMAKKRQGFSDFEASKTFAEESQRLFMLAKENAPKNMKLREIKEKARQRAIEKQGGLQ